MGFIATDEVKGAIISENFLSNVDYLINGKTMIHHLHITADVIRYAHSFCNLKIRENKNQISVVAHNLCGFDFFFFLKGLRLGAWRTTNLSFGGKNLANINFVNISNQVKFIDTYKYFQQSLSILANTMSDEERLGVRNEYKKFISRDAKLNQKFHAYSKTDWD